MGVPSVVVVMVMMEGAVMTVMGFRRCWRFSCSYSFTRFVSKFFQLHLWNMKNIALPVVLIIMYSVLMRKLF